MVALEQYVHGLPTDAQDYLNYESEWIWRPLRKPISCSNINAILEAEAEAYLQRQKPRVSHLSAIKFLRPFSVPSHAAFGPPSTPDFDSMLEGEGIHSEGDPDSDTLPDSRRTSFAAFDDDRYRRVSEWRDSYYYFHHAAGSGDIDADMQHEADHDGAEGEWGADEEELDSKFEFAHFRAQQQQSRPQGPRTMAQTQQGQLEIGWERSPVDMDFIFHDEEEEEGELLSPRDGETPELSPTSTCSGSSRSWELKTPDSSIVEMPIPMLATKHDAIDRMISSFHTAGATESDAESEDESNDEEESYHRTLLIASLREQLHALDIGRQAFRDMTSDAYTAQLPCLAELDDDDLVRTAPMDAFEAFCWADLVEDDQAASRRVSRALSVMMIGAASCKGKGKGRMSKRISVAPAPSPVQEGEDDESLSATSSTVRASRVPSSVARLSGLTVSSVGATTGSESARSSTVTDAMLIRRLPPPPLQFKPLPALPDFDLLDDEPSPLISQRREKLGTSVNLDPALFNVSHPDHAITAFPRPQRSVSSASGYKTPRGGKSFKPIHQILSSFRA